MAFQLNYAPGAPARDVTKIKTDSGWSAAAAGAIVAICMLCGAALSLFFAR
jgi:hypothetical protein